MMTNLLFRESVENVSPDVRRFVDISFRVAEKIDETLKRKELTQKDLAILLGKKESEVSRWLTGRHNFTLTTIAKIESVLGEHLLETT